MQNIDIKTEKKKLIITIDLSQEIGVSKSGKSMNIATTGGSHKFLYEDTMINLGINCYKAVPPAKK